MYLPTYCCLQNKVALSYQYQKLQAFNPARTSLISGMPNTYPPTNIKSHRSNITFRPNIKVGISEISLGTALPVVRPIQTTKIHNGNAPFALDCHILKKYHP